MTGRLASWATVAALIALGGSAATASALTTTPGAPLVHVSVPRGWKAVSYGGLTIDVPGSWQVSQRQAEGCGIPGPGLLVGPPYTGPLLLCAYSPQRGPVIIFGGPDAVFPAGHEDATVINGIEALVSKNYTPGIPQGASQEVVRFPGETVWLDIRVPGRASSRDWGVVEEVVATVRASR